MEEMRSLHRLLTLLTILIYECSYINIVSTNCVKISSINQKSIMAKSEIKANEIITKIKQGKSLDSVKSEVSNTPDEWFKYSNKAYNTYLKKVKKERKGIENRKHVSATSNEQVTEIIGRATFHPHLRALQKKGRIEKLDYFKVFSILIDAAILSYYRTNFISCYLTLLPVIEGVIIRWMGYTETNTKPDFEDVRKFFKNYAQRQPCPYNILFHNVYVKACDKILNNHFYKPTTSGNSWANFNRHVASHLLNDNQFGTKENCIRLFILFDAMTEIAVYESRINDPKFNIRDEEIENDINLYGNVILDNMKTTPEQTMFGTTFLDIKV